MCISGQGFKTNEIVDAKLEKQPQRAEGEAPVRKAIRFMGWRSGVPFRLSGTCNHFFWPSRNHSFLGDPNLKDSTVVIPIDVEVFNLQFEGQNCTAWTSGQCSEYADIIHTTFHAFPINDKLASKLLARMPATAGKKRRRPS